MPGAERWGSAASCPHRRPPGPAAAAPASALRGTRGTSTARRTFGQVQAVPGEDGTRASGGADDAWPSFGGPLERNCFGALTSEESPRNAAPPSPSLSETPRLLPPSPHLNVDPKVLQDTECAHLVSSPIQTRERGPYHLHLSLLICKMKRYLPHDLVYKEPSTELALAGCSVDTSFLLPGPAPATDLLCGLEQFHFTSVWGASLPHLTMRESSFQPLPSESSDLLTH